MLQLIKERAPKIIIPYPSFTEKPRASFALSYWYVICSRYNNPVTAKDSISIQLVHKVSFNAEKRMSFSQLGKKAVCTLHPPIKDNCLFIALA